MSIEMSMTTDPAEIRNSADGDVPSEREPCPESCGTQSWSCVPTPGFDRRWRCETYNRYISDAVQAADDRRSL